MVDVGLVAALEKTDGPEKLEENAQTIRPNRSPATSANTSLIKAPAPEISPIVEDYSDIGDDDELEEKVADFKVIYSPFDPHSVSNFPRMQMKNSVRKGLFHPNDIKTIGLGKISPSPATAPLPPDHSKAVRPGPSPIASSSHSRASSVSGSFGRSDARRAMSSSDFGRYTEGEDEDYEDVFAKPNGTSMSTSFHHL
jgi:hypothetical protein